MPSRLISEEECIFSPLITVKKQQSWRSTDFPQSPLGFYCDRTTVTAAHVRPRRHLAGKHHFLSAHATSTTSHPQNRKALSGPNARERQDQFGRCVDLCGFNALQYIYNIPSFDNTSSIVFYLKSMYEASVRHGIKVMQGCFHASLF